MVTDTILTDRIAVLEAQLYRRSHDPAWSIANSAAVHDQIACLPPLTPVVARVGDVADLKQWNGALGSQAPVDAMLARGFASIHLRAGDIFGRGDGGDKLYLVVTGDNADAVTARINATLKATPLRKHERAAYVRGVCAKAWGPCLGRLAELAHYTGVRPIVDYPTIDWASALDGDAGAVLTRMGDADRALFVSKAARLHA